ncbi:psbP domain-containing protein 5, chloroplastic [Beta vulgaris subsp. vulgaris]|uniref:psbP domain-containing protein 5, chloroplastic n=1 Tax=Beta vulgaris subsp. vulgaris TaxID=3555 RepID=UPI002547FC0F|nr:psbP domain-containing protein 5, chloroplastic [Beta vulgaris subsp. vulgaris]
MASVFLSSIPPIFNSLSKPIPHTLFFRNQINFPVFQKNYKSEGKFIANSSISSSPNSEFGFYKRDLLLFGFSTSLTLIFPNLGIGAEEEVKMANFVDDINAYTYSYPLELPSKKRVFKWVESRKPERYSSAAPLSLLCCAIDNLIISVTIGPPNPEFLKSKDKSTWKAKDVADSVLSDKSALRVTSTQKLAESSILDAHSDEVDGEQYWLYEYLVRKSPTKSARESNNYRQYVASTAERDGFLYTVNASTLSKQWELMGPIVKSTVNSFRLLPATENYVSPSKDPWRFW